MSARETDARGQRGETLIELIVAVAIMGTSIVVLVAALAAAVANATRQKTDAKGQSVLNTYAERATRVPFIPCATPDDYTDRLPAPEGDYKPSVARVASWDGAAYRSGSRLDAAIDASATTIQVQDPAGLPPASAKYEIRVDAAAGTPPEQMSVTSRAANTLTVTRTAGIAHDAEEAVSVCPDPLPGSTSQSSYQAQLLDLEVDGPPVSQLGTSSPYTAAMSVAKRGPLRVPELRATAVAPAPPAKAGTEVSLTDKATLTLPPGATAPTGTMTFSLYGPDPSDPDTIACTAPPVKTSTTPLAGVAPDPSGAFVVDGEAPFYIPPRAGRYGWVVAYSGDAANEGATGVCGAAGQSIVVGQATPTVTTLVLSPSGGAPDVVGGETKVAARLVSAATPTGEITFELYGPADATTCEGTPLVVQTPPVAVAPNGDDTPSQPFTFTEPGKYRWKAIYGGDDNNAPRSGCLEKAIEVTEP